MLHVKPLVSVLIPSYNHALFVRESIASVWAQDWGAIELIVADDGSKDDSAEIIESMLTDSPIPMKFLRLEHGGLIKTLNKAFEESTGDFIAVIASDDRFRREKISGHLDLMLNDPEIVLSHCDVAVIDEHGKASPLDVSSRGNPAQGYVGMDVLLGRAYIRYSPVMRRDSLEKVGRFDDRYPIEDWPLYLKMAFLGKIGYVDKRLTERRVHGMNWSTLSARAPDTEFKFAALDLIEFYSPSLEIFEQAAAVHMCSSLKGTLYQGDIRGGLALGKAIHRKFPGQLKIVCKSFMLGIASFVWGRYIKSRVPPQIQAVVVKWKDKLVAG